MWCVLSQVSDFGLSRVMDAISAANGTAAATAESFWGGDTSASTSGSGAPLGHNPAQHFGALSHAAPELIRGEALGKASDVYSVGVLLWELVTGQVGTQWCSVARCDVLTAILRCPHGPLLQVMWLLSSPGPTQPCGSGRIC